MTLAATAWHPQASVYPSVKGDTALPEPGRPEGNLTGSYLSHWAVEDGKPPTPNPWTWSRAQEPSEGTTLLKLACFPVGRKLAGGLGAQAGVSGSRSHFSGVETETGWGYHFL